ncbi:MAG: Hydrolase, alpha/beta fold family protein [Bradyrhizobium sp.]|nr:Hydrolase, alpha/beta fold family protein [Bradyrhizobium sp.]
MTVHYRTVDVDGLEIFYREAGDADAPTLLLLHGFPTSSHMFRTLIPLLEDRFHLIAPDLPGFGKSAAPSNSAFTYTFDNVAKVMTRFTERLGLDRFAIYIFDYGAPTGLRMALHHPERVTAIISQNGNAYEAGLSDEWNFMRRYWNDPSEENRNAQRAQFEPAFVLSQYMTGVSDPALVSPDDPALDSHYLERENVHEAQLDFILDYASNVELYPAFHAYFREHQPPLLAIWGKNDPYFIPPGAEAFKTDLPDAIVGFVDSGHFALETHVGEIAREIGTFWTHAVEKKEPASA